MHVIRYKQCQHQPISESALFDVFVTIATETVVALLAISV